MGRLASQTAAHKLGQILGLLVIPIIILWTMYFFSAKQEIDGLDGEIAGVAAAQNINVATDKRAARLHAIIRSSGLALDSERESHALADAGLLLVPVLQEKLLHLNGAFKGRSSAAAAVADEKAEHAFLLAMADTKESLSSIDESLILASIRNVKSINDDFAILQNAVRDFENAAANLTAAAEPQVTVAASRDLQSNILTELKSRLEVRRSVAWRNLILLTLAGATSALAGMGLAIMMMRSTLLRLDEVELSRAEAHAARREAEQLALRFSTINNDISNLNQELATKVKELKNVQDELIKKGRLEQLGQLTATIAHEIRNPLGSIRTSAFLLERKTSSMGEDVSGHLQRINNGVNRCDTIISQLLDFSRTKEVNSSLALLDDWLAKIVREEAQRLPEHVYIECALGLEDVKVAFDPARLQRAIINLLSNASEALCQTDHQERQPGHQHATIWVTTLRSGDFALIRIADNGPGIALENLQKIREPLFTTKSFGTGLGVPAVEQIVTQHNGHLEISSEYGAGATFTIHLPLPDSNREAA